MNASVILLLCGVVGSVVGYYPERQLPYNTDPNGPYSAAVKQNFIEEPSQRLFFGNGQGSNQVGGTGWWAMLTNKFPFLGNMFGRMELPTEYGPPGTYQQYYNQVPQTYQPPQNYLPSQTYQAPQSYQAPQIYQAPQTYQAPQAYQALQAYQARQTYQTPQTYQARQAFQTPQSYQQFRSFGQRFTPTGRDVGLTDDAVIVTPPHVPIAPQPAPGPQPAPEPSPDGYQYNKPQYKLELPHK